MFLSLSHYKYSNTPFAREVSGSRVFPERTSYEADGTNNGRTEANQRANVSKTIEETYASSIHRNIF